MAIKKLRGLESAKPTLEAGQMYVATDTNKLFIGLTLGEITIRQASDFYLKTEADNLLSSKQSTSTKGQANGYAELDSGGKVPTAQLPSYVDDVIEAANFAALPATGESAKIYVTLDTNIIYRWSGTAYVEISQSLALGEMSSTAYRGDRGKTAYDHTLSMNNPHSVTATQVGLGNVTNESKATMFTNPTFTGTVTISSPFILGATSVTATGTELNTLVGSGFGSGYLTYFNGTKLTNSGIYTNGTNYGIGTTGPGQTLHVFSGGNGGIRLQRTGIMTSSWDIKPGDYNSNDLDFWDNVAGSSRMIINSTGNVGIGTTSPSGRLDLVGSQNFSALSAPTALTAGTPTAGGSCTPSTHSYKVTLVSIGNGETTGGTTSNQITCVLTTGQTVPLSNIPTGPAGTLARKIYRTVAGDTGSYLLLTTISDNTTTTFSDTVADASLGTAAPVSNTTAVANLQTGGTTRMVIDNTGNVGIGTTNLNYQIQGGGTNYQSKVMVSAGSADDGLMISNTGAGQGGSLMFSQLNNANNQVLTSAIEGFMSDRTIGAEKGYLIFQTKTAGLYITERMRITNTGNVGIGRTDPISKLAVVGLPIYADNTSALAGGLTAGDFYRTSIGILMVTY